ncbi:hypothetical protein E5K83_03575 [Helicobacter pylori]|nr:hypothetical protein E5K83_03575 [Helicobacter pylori]
MYKLGVFLLATLLFANTQKVSDIAKDIQHKETLLKKTHEEKKPTKQPFEFFRRSDPL